MKELWEFMGQTGMLIHFKAMEAARWHLKRSQEFEKVTAVDLFEVEKAYRFASVDGVVDAQG